MTPPSGKFIVQLFLVPGLIVGIIVGLLLFFTWAFGGPRSPGAFLRKLDDPNKEVRWRGAADLAQVLKRDDRLASDGGFASELAARLERATESSAEAERSLAERWSKLKPEEAEAESRKLEPERNYSQYLMACLGNFRVPAGVPMLRRLAEDDKGLEPGALKERRRKAVWSLADLGQNLSRFENLPLPDQDVILASLDKLADTDALHGQPAKEMSQFLRDRRAGHPRALGVDLTLEKCAGAEDSFLRELTALALNFWPGTPAEEERMEKTLLQLAHDDGRSDVNGKSSEQFPKEQPRSVVTSPGLRVRLNATVALARRGSQRVRLDQLEEMLNVKRLGELCRVRAPDGTERSDDAFAAQTQLAALRSILELRKKQPSMDLASLTGEIKRLAN
ncbi:MAG: hypothetical protein ACRD36_10160, partial [Candidatus Acidiferrum sp.]